MFMFMDTTKSQTNCCASACHSVADLISLSIRHFTCMCIFLFIHRTIYEMISKSIFAKVSFQFVHLFVRSDEKYRHIHTYTHSF